MSCFLYTLLYTNTDIQKWWLLSSTDYKISRIIKIETVFKKIIRFCLIHPLIFLYPFRSPFTSQSLENTTFSRLFSFLRYGFFTRFCPIFIVFHVIFPLTKSSENPCYIWIFGALILDMFLEIFLVCAVHFNFEG